ncbi:MAG: phosphoheptose isomerase [Patescibacteria group bacterium]
MIETTIDLQITLDEKGRHASPLLSSKIQNLIIDIDGTICDDIPNEEPERMATAEEMPNAKRRINEWYDAGNIITFFTSRRDVEHGDITKKWLEEHGFKYHNIIFNKPRGGNYHWIDNLLVKTSKFEGNFDDLVV